MSIGGPGVRAFRPSRFARQDEFDDETQRAKEQNVLRYAQRAEAGLPLFDVSLLAKEAAIKSAKFAI